MDRSALLKALPFLYTVTPTDGPLIWKQHWDIISHHAASTKEDDSEKLFACHVLSIEPIAHHVGNTAGVAFFSNKKKQVDSWNNTESSVSSEGGEPGDPALVSFAAYLLPGYHQRCSEDGMMRTPLRRKKEGSNGHTGSASQPSPAVSTASTTMSNSLSPKTPNGTKAVDATADETNILYFVVGQEVYCVDHYQIRSIEIEQPSTSAAPISLLLTFDSCAFRVFYDDVITNSEERHIREQEAVLQNCFLKLKNFMLSDGKNYAELRSSHGSFVSYLGQLTHTLSNGESSAGSQYENGQTTNDIAMGNSIMAEEDSLGNRDANTDQTGGSGGNNDETEISNPIVQRLDAYDKSWNALQSLHAVLKLHKRGKIAGNLDQDDNFFATLANKSAVECMKSFVEIEEDATREEMQSNGNLSEIQQSVDEIVRKIFPAKNDNLSASSMAIDDERDLEAQALDQLLKYKNAVNAKHRSLAFLPKR